MVLFFWRAGEKTLSPKLELQDQRFFYYINSIFELTFQPMKSNPEGDAILIKLFGSVSRARIIGLLVSQAGRSFYQREIMYETGLSLHPTQREVKNLIDLKIIKKRETRDRVYYEIDPHSPFFKPLCEIFESAQKSKK